MGRNRNGKGTGREREEAGGDGKHMMGFITILMRY